MVRSRMAVRRKSRSRSRLSWATLTVVPWCLAGGLLVSMGADAGQAPAHGLTSVGLTDAAAMPGDLVPSALMALGTSFPLPPDDAFGRAVRRAAGDVADVPDEGDEIEPRALAKAGDARPAPAVARSLRENPATAVAPTFAAPLRAAGALPSLRAAALAFEDADGMRGGFVPGPVDTPRADPPAAPSLTDEPQSFVLPRAAREATLDDGVGNVAHRWPDHAAVIETARSAPEQRCLAQAVYFEARSEPEEGQAAVAQVVLNRATSGLYPGSVCGVVFQNQQHRNACQFSFACEGHALHVAEDEAWTRAVRIARAVTEGATYVSDIGGSTHYHATGVTPAWARTLTRTDAIGHHVFYAMKPRQT